MNVENHHIEFCNKVNDICKPLFSLGINYFHFIRSYSDGSRISLSNNHEWSEYYYKNEFYRRPAIDKNSKVTLNACYLWAALQNSPIFQHLKENFDIEHGFTLTRKSLLYTDFFYFGTYKKNNEIYNLYFNNLAIFNRFSHYFMEAGSKIIQRAEKKRIHIPFEYLPVASKIKFGVTDSLQCINIKKMENFLEQTPVKKYHMVFDGQNIIIPKRELQSIICLLNGMDIKEAAHQLSLSSRTLRSYIDNLKNRTNCHTTSELLTKFRKDFPTDNKWILA